jgi:two-component system OmpR family sensor kinase
LSIRWRLTLLNALIMVAILLVVGFFLFFLLRGALLSGVKDTAKNRAVELAKDVEEESGQDLLFDEGDAEELALDGVFAVVRDAEGRVLDQTVELESDEGANDTIWREALESGQPTGGAVQLSRGDVSDYVYAVPVSPAHGSARVVEAGKSYDAAEEVIGTLTSVLVGGALVAFLLSACGAYLLARAALSPVDAVVESAREITEGDLSKRLPVAHKGDEIGRLTTTINGLLARLEEAFARLEAALARLKEALARQRRFTADASHELRTPLTSISGYAQLLEEGGLSDPRVAGESVAAIRRETEHMRELVETLLALARGDEDASLDPEFCDLGAVAEEAVESARAVAKDKVAIWYAPPERPIVVFFDRGRVRQAVSILLDNAVKYTPNGGRVAVAVHQSEEWAKVEVSDSGIGIPEDQLPLVFERFHQADEARASGGAGLGLAIARQIAEAHGGRIEAKSSLGEGSAFTLLLPRKHPSSMASDLDQRTSGPGGSAGEAS